MRPLRSVLYMPGSNQRALEKAKSLSADALILDLEDAVAPDQKANGRALIRDAVNAGGYGGRYLVVRINAFDSPWGDGDLAEIANCAPDAILLPKVGRASDITALADKMAAHPKLAESKIWAMMESPLGILNAAEIAASSDRIECLVLGTNDLIKDMHATFMPDRSCVLAALTQCILAARAHGLFCLDGVFNDIQDEAGLAAECTQGRALGFDGKTLIHPRQLEVTNETFGPSDAELETARLFVAAFDEALSKGQAVAVVNGRIVENLHVENAKRLLAQSAAIAAFNSESDTQ